MKHHAAAALCNRSNVSQLAVAQTNDVDENSFPLDLDQCVEGTVFASILAIGNQQYPELLAFRVLESVVCQHARRSI